MTTETTSTQATAIPERLTEKGSEIFRKAVGHLINDWPSLDLAIENGMGGSEAREKRDWMSKTIAETMLKGKDLDVQAFLEDILDQEFDTIIEDGSLEYTSSWIEKFYKDCLQGKEEDVLCAITQASMKKLKL